MGKARPRVKRRNQRLTRPAFKQTNRTFQPIYCTWRSAIALPTGFQGKTVKVLLLSALPPVGVDTLMRPVLAPGGTKKSNSELLNT